MLRSMILLYASSLTKENFFSQNKEGFVIEFNTSIKTELSYKGKIKDLITKVSLMVSY